MTSSQKKQTWLVRNQYRMRFSAFALLFIAASLDTFSKNRSLTDWGFLGLLLLVYPHIQYWRTCRSGDALQSELSHLVVDAVVVGALVAATGGSLWIAFAAVLGTLMDNVTNKGWTTLPETCLGFIVGGILWTVWRGFELSPDSSWPATLFCMIGLSAYLVVMSNSWHQRQAQLRQTRTNLKDRETQLLSTNLTLNTQLEENSQLQQRLKDSHQFQVALMESIPVPIFYKDIQGHYLGFNKAYEDFLGKTRSALMGKTVFDIAPKSLAEIYHLQDQQLMSGQGVQVYGSQVKDHAGDVHDVIFHKACFLDNGGKVQGLIGAVLDITKQKQSERALIEGKQRTQALYTLLRRVADNVPDMIWAKDLDKRYLFANKAVCEQLLMACDTSEPIGKDDLFFAMRERVSHAENPQWHTFGELCQDSDAITLRRGCASQFDEYGNVKGQLLYLDVHKAPLTDEGGELIGVVGSARDVTSERAAQEKLRVAAAVLANSSEALMLSDANNCIVDINPAFTRLTGYTLDEVKGRTPDFLHSGRQSKGFYQAMWAQVQTSGHWQGEVWNRRKNGEVYAEWLTINTLYHDDGTVHRRVGLFSDITDKKNFEDIIWTQANFDLLTDLPNRRMLNDRLNQTLTASKRSHIHGALMFLDLDNFKPLNDRHGHGVGDLLLIEVARRLSKCVREADTVARFGGDEFVVLLSELHLDRSIAREQAQIVAEKIRGSLAAPYRLMVAQTNQADTIVEHHCHASIGIVVFVGNEADHDDILRLADAAMYRAKHAGRNTIRFCDESLGANS